MSKYATLITDSLVHTRIKTLVVKYLYGGYIDVHMGNWVELYRLAREIQLDCLEKDLISCAVGLKPLKLLAMAEYAMIRDLYSLFIVVARQYPLNEATYTKLGSTICHQYSYLSKHTDDPHIDQLCFELTVRSDEYDDLRENLMMVRSYGWVNPSNIDYVLEHCDKETLIRALVNRPGPPTTNAEAMVRAIIH
jgi:hypothetical protein